MTITRGPDFHTVQVDIYFARRKRLHTVYDHAGAPVFSDPHLMNVLDWLVEQDVTTARFTDDQVTYLVTFERTELEPLSEELSENG